ncbi:DUF6343 family protein [Streptomyces sp. NPDC052109]|uniref:DUF6343 family protein n=1 Tax=Streptomyces sp. NPDC052109 TaxID=3155527 RepID=UPI00341EDEF6
MRHEHRGHTAAPGPRSRFGFLGHRPPHTGSEPTTALSALRLRQLLSALFLPLFVAATAGFALWAAGQGPGDSPGSGPLTALAVVCGVLALAAALDLVVVTGRRRRERAAGTFPPGSHR